MYKICIPSLGRPQNVKPPKELGLPGERFIIFVNTEDEAGEYRKENPGIEVVTTNVKGITKTRNFMLNYFKHDENIVMMDDDVTGLYEYFGEKDLRKIPADELDKFIERGFKLCRLNKTKLWGVYPTYNHFYMSMGVCTNGFIVGMFMGIIIGNLRFDENLRVKDDYGMTIEAILRYKKIIRFNNVCIKASYKTNAGGASVYRTLEKEKADADYLVGKYPRYVRHNTNRKGHEILLTFRQKKKKC